MKNQKGITLVALIITIIVMLILVSVSVAILINSNILGTAEDAGNRYEEEVRKEQELDNSVTIKTPHSGDKSFGEYVEELKTTSP